MLAFIAPQYARRQRDDGAAAAGAARRRADDVFLQHDLNLFNFVIRLNRALREQDLELAPVDELDFAASPTAGCRSSRMPDRWTNFIDLQTRDRAVHAACTSCC